MLIKVLNLALYFLILFGNSRQDNAPQQHWAVLVAGSNSYSNYRHQADICHAYHIVRKHGIPAERIITLMFDDIAKSPLNPFPGNIINRPNGSNVYPGVIIDYKAEEVTPDTFLKVLTGDSAGLEKLLGRKGKVLQSGPNDTVFVNFVDHGAPGILSFPNQARLHAKDLNSAIEKMHTNKQYKHLVFYVEACFSGSMFDNILKKDINVFVTTAANPNESSNACYWDKTRLTFLGDLYSVNWMQDSDVENLKTESLQDQFKLVKKETNLSHVMEYGDLTLSKLSVGDFQGNLTDNTRRPRHSKRYNPNADAVPAEDVPLAIARMSNDQEAIEKLIHERDSAKTFFQQVVMSASNIDYTILHERPINFIKIHDCYKASIDELTKVCPGMKFSQNHYAFKGLVAFAHLCEADMDIEKILTTIRTTARITPFCKDQ